MTHSHCGISIKKKFIAAKIFEIPKAEFKNPLFHKYKKNRKLQELDHIPNFLLKICQDLDFGVAIEPLPTVKNVVQKIFFE